MDALGVVQVALHEAYISNVVTVLETLHLGTISLWIGALGLLILKLVWKPLDSATTYGKLLTTTSRNETSAESESEQLSKKDPKASTDAFSGPDTSSLWLNQRFSFTSSYIIGLILSLGLAIALFSFILLFQNAIHLETAKSCDPLPISYQKVPHTRVDDYSTGRSAIDIESSISGSFSDDSLIGDAYHIDEVHETRYHQSVCSLIESWVQKSKSWRTVISDATAVDLIIFAMSNASLVRAVILTIIVIGHLLRRTLECLFVHSFSPRNISFYNVLLMWAYYVAMPIALLIDMALETARGALNPAYAPYGTKSVVSIASGLELFIIGSVLQYASHRILANGRAQTQGNESSTPQTKRRYFVPQDGAFQFVSSPHYLAESLIYISFTLVSGGTTTSLLILAFVIITMVSQAQKTHAWYLANFPAQKLGQRKALIPFVW